jgi:sugar lactone lactonase YvrE
MIASVVTHLKTPVISLLVFAGLGFSGHSQDTITAIPQKSLEIPQIRWVKQWPSADKKQKTHTFKTRFNAIFLGKKTPVLSRPVSVLALNPGNFWILDQGAKSIFHVQREVGEIPHFIRKSTFDFSSLVGICAIPPDGFIFTDSHAKKIYKILPEKKQLQILNDTIPLDQPTGIAFSSVTNQIYVVETNAHRIAVLNEKGEIVKHIGSRGTAAGEFNYPTHIWIDKAGLLYVIDAMNFRVQILSSEGEVISVFGEPGDASGYFARPKGIATDSHGNIYIVDALFHVVQVFDMKGVFLYNLGNQGQKQGEFWMPSGIFIDDSDFVYIADCYNSRIQVFQLVYGNKK